MTRTKPFVRDCLLVASLAFLGVGASGCSSNTCACGLGGVEQGTFPGAPASCSGDVYVVVPVPADLRDSFPCNRVYVFCDLQGTSGFVLAQCLDAAPVGWVPYGADAGSGVDASDAGVDASTRPDSG